MSASQIVRIAPPNPANFNNPTNLTLDVKPSRILIGIGAPNSTDGSLFDYFIASDTGNLYMKDAAGIWEGPIYNFSTSPGSGLTDLTNLGAGAFIYAPPPIAGIASLKSLVSTTGKITFLSEPNDISLGVNLNSSDVGLPLVQNIRNNYNATVDPNNLNDSTQNYSIGSLWWNDTGARLFICQSNTIGSAVWTLINVTASGFITNLNNVGGGFQIFQGLSGTVANLRTITSSDASITITQAPNVIDFTLQPKPRNDFAVFGFTNNLSTQLPAGNVEVPLNQPWALASFRGNWDTGGVSPQLNPRRISALNTTLQPPFFYNVAVNISMQSDQNGLVAPAKVVFVLRPVGGNSSFPGNFSESNNAFVGPFAAIFFNTTINTVWRINDNNPASFFLSAFSADNLAQRITNINTQCTITQI